MVRVNKPSSKPCLQPGCEFQHPYWLHEALTGGKLNAELQAKMVAFETRKREKANSKNGDLVAVTIADYSTCESGTADEDDDENETRSLFFVGVASVRNSPFDTKYVLFDTQAALSLFMDATHRDLEERVIFLVSRVQMGEHLSQHKRDYFVTSGMLLSPQALTQILFRSAIVMRGASKLFGKKRHKPTRFAVVLMILCSPCCLTGKPTSRVKFLMILLNPWMLFVSPVTRFQQSLIIWRYTHLSSESKPPEHVNCRLSPVCNRPRELQNC